MTGQGLVLPTFISYLVSVAVSAIPKLVVIVSVIYGYLQLRIKLVNYAAEQQLAMYMPCIHKISVMIFNFHRYQCYQWWCKCYTAISAINGGVNATLLLVLLNYIHSEYLATNYSSILIYFCSRDQYIDCSKTFKSTGLAIT